MISVSLAWTKDSCWLCHDRVLLENPSSQMGTCAQRGSTTHKEKSDTAELVPKEQQASMPAKPACPHHALVKDPSNGTFSRCAPPLPCWCDAEGLHPQTGRVVAACCHMAHVPDSSVHHGWKAWTHQGLLTVWATAPGFSSTQGGLLPEATVHCTTGRRGQRSQQETHRPFPHWDCTQDTPSAPTLTVHSGKGSPNPGNAPVSCWQKR